MNASITITKATATQSEVDQVVALAKARGWTVEWNLHEVA